MINEPVDAMVETRVKPELQATSPHRSIQLSVIVPTFSEHDNVSLLVDRLRDVLSGIAWEVVFVDDDSPDATADRVRAIAQTDARVRCIQRIGRRGLSSACIEGVLSSAAPYVAIMDADLQHDEQILPQMLDLLGQQPRQDQRLRQLAEQGGL